MKKFRHDIRIYRKIANELVVIHTRVPNIGTYETFIFIERIET
jgi:hypothetical protein